MLGLQAEYFLKKYCENIEYIFNYELARGLISYFDKDDATVFNYSKNIDVSDSYNNIFNF